MRGATALLAVAASCLTALAMAPAVRAADPVRACAIVANTTPYTYPVRIGREGRRPASLSVPPKKLTQLCSPEPIPPDEKIVVEVRSFWAPLGECHLLSGGTVEISRYPSDESNTGEMTRVTCRN